MLDAFINCNKMFCSYWFLTWLAVIFYNWKDHCSGRHNLICSCEMKAWKNSWCQGSILINNELASQQSSLHYLFSSSSPHFSSVLRTKQLWRKSVSEFSFTCNKYPPQFTGDKSNNSWMREGILLDALNVFERRYKLHTPKSVNRERSKAWPLSVVLLFR